MSGYTIETTDPCFTCGRGTLYTLTGPDFHEEFPDPETAAYVAERMNAAYEAGRLSHITKLQKGRRAAQARGQKMGRPSKLTEYQRSEAIQRYKDGDSGPKIARSFNVSNSTVWRLLGGVKREEIPF